MMIKIVVYIVDGDGTLAYYIRIYNKTTRDGGILAYYICACIILRDGGGQCLFTTQRQCHISAVWYHTAVLLLWDAVNDGRRCVCVRTLPVWAIWALRSRRRLCRISSCAYAYVQQRL